jgi:hypothetical protein
MPKLFSSQDLIIYLRYHDFPVEGDTQAKVDEVLATSGSQGAWLQVKGHLATALGQNPADRQRFERLFEAYLDRHPELSTPTSLSSSAAPDEIKDSSSGWWANMLSQRRFYILLQLLLLTGLGYLGVRGVDCYLQTRDVAQAYRCFIGARHLERSRMYPGPPPADSLALDPESATEAPMEDLPPEATYRQAAPNLAQQVPLPPAGVVPTDISDLEKSWMDRYRLVFKWLAIVAIVTFFLFITLRRRMRRRWHQQRDRHQNSPHYRAPRLPERTPQLKQEADLGKVLSWLQQPDLFAPPPPSSAPTPAPGYLLLIEQQSPQDLLATFYDQLGQELAKRGLHLTRYFFENDPRLCWQDRQQEETYFEDLLQQHPTHRLLLISRLAPLLDPLSGTWAKWMSLMQRPSPVIVLTPEVAPSITWVQAARQAGLLLGPATLPGLLALAQLPLSGDQAVPSLPWREADLPALSASPDIHTVPALRAYCQALPLASDQPALGDRLFHWLCACALHPKLTWEITLAIGQRLGEEDDQPVNGPAGLIHLLRLPWFRLGAMPDPLRAALQESLPPREERLARQTILETLEANPPPAGSYAYDAYQLQLATQRMALSTRWDHSLRQWGHVREYALYHSLDDEVLRHHLAQGPKATSWLKLPPGLLFVFFHQGIPLLGLRPWVRGMVSVAMVLGMLLLVKGYTWQNWQRYDQTWYYLADDTARMRFYSYVGVEELTKGHYLAARNNLREAEDLRERLQQDDFLDPAYHLAYLSWQSGEAERTPITEEAFARVSDAADVALQDSSLTDDTRTHLATLRAHAQYNQGMMYLASNQPQQALEALREAAKQDPGQLLPQTRYAEALALVQNSLQTSREEADQQLLLAVDRLQTINQQQPGMLAARPELARVLDSLQTITPQSPIQQRYAELATVARGESVESIPLDTLNQELTTRPTDGLAAQVALVTPFQEGKAVVTYQGRYGFLTETGKLLGGALPYEDARPFQEGLAAVRQGGRWGYVNEQLRPVIPFRYQKALDLRDGWAAVRNEAGYWGVIDRQGRVQLPFAYEKAVEFELEASLPPGAQALGVVYVPREPRGKYQYLNKRGEVVFPDQLFQAADNFAGATARVMRYEVMYQMDRNGDCLGALAANERCPTETWGRSLLRVMRTHRAGISAAAFSPGGQVVATVSLDSTLRLWSGDGSKLLAAVPQEAVLRTVAAAANRVATGNDAGQLTLWNVSGQRLAQSEDPRAAIWSLAFAPDGTELAVGLRNGDLARYDGQTLRPLGRLRTRQGMTVLGLAYSPDGQSLAAGSEDGQLRLWRAGSLQPAWTAGLGTAVQALAFSPDGQTVAAGNRDGRVLLYRQADGGLITSFRPHNNWLSALQFSPDGRYLLTAAYDQQVRVFRLADQQEVLHVRLRTTVTAATFSPDGQRLLITTRGSTGAGLDQALLFELDRY